MALRQHQQRAFLCFQMPFKGLQAPQHANANGRADDAETNLPATEAEPDHREEPKRRQRRLQRMAWW